MLLSTLYCITRRHVFLRHSYTTALCSDTLVSPMKKQALLEFKSHLSPFKLLKHHSIQMFSMINNVMYFSLKCHGEDGKGTRGNVTANET